MIRTSLILILAALAGTAVHAQALGSVVSVNGIATVTTGSSGVAVTTGTPVFPGSRVITTSNATVTVRLNNGCTVTVPPGHAVTVLSSVSCGALQAAVQPVTTATTTSTASVVSTVPVGPTFAGTPGVVAGWAALVVLGLAANEIGSDRPLSGR